MLPAEEMSGPQMDELWKKRKKIPKKRTMIGSTWVRVKSAYLQNIGIMSIILQYFIICMWLF